MSKKTRELKIETEKTIDIVQELDNEIFVNPEVIETSIEKYLDEYLNVYLNPAIKLKVIKYISNDIDKAKQIVKYVNTIGLSSLKSLQVI
jgi:hypothetical protein